MKVFDPRVEKFIDTDNAMLLDADKAVKKFDGSFSSVAFYYINSVAPAADAWDYLQMNEKRNNTLH